MSMPQGTSSSKSTFSRYNGNQTDTGDIGLATAPAAARSANSDNSSSHTALPSLSKSPQRIQSLRDGIAKQAKKNYGSNYGERDRSISGLIEGKERPRKAASVSPSTVKRPSDLSHGDPMASLIAAFSDMKLRPKTLQDNKQRSTIRDTVRTHTMRPSFSVHLLHHKGKVKHPYRSKKDAILGGDAKRHSSIVTLSALCHQKIILGRELSSRSLRAFGRLSQSDTGSDQPVEVPVSAEHSRLDVEEGAPKEQNRDQNDPAPGTTEPTPPTHYKVEAIIDQKWSKSRTGESENEAAVHASPAVSDVSTAHHGTVHTSAPVATLTFSSDFSSTQDLDQDVEMADAFGAPFEGYLRPAGLPTWLTDYGYSWYLRMLNHVGQDVEMVDAWDIDP
ncbi:hypothetical protein BU17DRAFT_101440 [Hysterangium stoloniferum]|nr:hypothetical protein BU17DRAFT_101440 [Hysterangium stoloniferum]